MLELRLGIFDLPCALLESAARLLRRMIGTCPEELAECGVVGLAWFALDVFLAESATMSNMVKHPSYQILGKPESQCS